MRSRRLLFCVFSTQVCKVGFWRIRVTLHLVQFWNSCMMMFGIQWSFIRSVCRPPKVTIRLLNVNCLVVCLHWNVGGRISLAEVLNCILIISRWCSCSRRRNLAGATRGGWMSLLRSMSRSSTCLVVRTSPLTHFREFQFPILNLALHRVCRLLRLPLLPRPQLLLQFPSARFVMLLCLARSCLLSMIWLVFGALDVSAVFQVFLRVNTKLVVTLCCSVMP